MRCSRHRDGQLRVPALHQGPGEPLSTSCSTPQRDEEDDQFVGMVGVGQNITELKQEKVEMSRIADDLMRLIDYANAPIFGIDRMGKVSEWNRKASGASTTLHPLPTLHPHHPPPPRPSPHRLQQGGGDRSIARSGLSSPLI